MSNSQFPPNCPEKLIAEFHACDDNMSELARRLGVNKGHVHNLLIEGKEPRRVDLREKLFLPAKVREPIPAWVANATKVLEKLEAQAAPIEKRIYSRDGRRVR